MRFYHCRFAVLFHDQSPRNVWYFLGYLQYCHVEFLIHKYWQQHQMQLLLNAIHCEFDVPLQHLNLKQRALHPDNAHLTICDIAPKFVDVHKFV
ncbi:hypothetical protein D3C71_1925830 [compost metagenome]